MRCDRDEQMFEAAPSLATGARPQPKTYPQQQVSKVILPCCQMNGTDAFTSCRNCFALDIIEFSMRNSTPSMVT